MKKKVTTTDIAKMAGVSQATVSMILNKKYNVSFSRETIEKVEKAAEELGYHKSECRRARKLGSEAHRCLLPDSHESLLCDAASGH